MKLISKQEPVKPVAPYVWGAKYLVLDSVEDEKDVETGDIVVVTEDYFGDFKVSSEDNYDYIHPRHLQLIDAVPQVEIVYTLELTESELQGIVVGIGQSKHPDRVFSTKLNGFPEEVASISPKTYDEILNLLKESK